MYNAINDSNCVPRDGSVQLTVILFYENISFDSTPTVEVVVPPTIITDATLGAVLTAVGDMTKGDQSAQTPLGLGIQLAAEQITGDNLIAGARQILNISTDGGPNVDLDGNIVSEGLGRAAAESARNASLVAGIDEISAEGIGSIREGDIAWLQNSIVFPQPGNIATVPPFTPGWVYAVTDAGQFKEAIGQKLVSYTLTVNIVGSGSVTKNPDHSTYAYGTSVELTAISDQGWTFTAWSEDLSGSTNPDSVTMTANKSVTATFTTLPPPTPTPE